MGLLIWIALCGVGLWLAPRVRSGEPWILRWGWLLSLSMIAFGITSGTRASWQQWIVGTVQAWIAAGICCELRIRQTRLPPLAEHGKGDKIKVAAQSTAVMQDLGVSQPEELKAFSARFRSETLEAFKGICKNQNKQYTKVLESLAEAYVRVGGELRQAVVDCLREGSSEGEISALLGGGAGVGLELADRIQEIEEATKSSLMEVKGSSESLDLRLASLEEMISEMGTSSERTRVEIMGAGRTANETSENIVVPPKDWRELVGRFMELEDSIRGEDAGLEMRVEILESIAEEQGFSVKWESGDNTYQSEGMVTEEGDIDMDEII